jgi:hypothetical protein
MVLLLMPNRYDTSNSEFDARVLDALDQCLHRDHLAGIDVGMSPSRRLV